MSDLPTPAPAPSIAPVLIGVEEFQRVQLRVGVIRQAEIHPNADRLLVLQVDLGNETRQVVAGIKQSYEPSALLGKQVIVVANMKPAVLRGIESQGMVLAASTDTALALLTTDRPAPVGSLVK